MNSEPERPEEYGEGASLPVRTEGRPVPTDPLDNVFDVFPRGVPPDVGPPPPAAESRRYILPLFLLGLVVIILAFSAITASDPAAERELTHVETPELSAERRLAEARKLIAEGDRLWEEGYRGWNDPTTLAESANQYREAWYLLTEKRWNRVNHQMNAGVTPTRDSSEARILTEKVKSRLVQLEETLR